MTSLATDELYTAIVHDDPPTGLLDAVSASVRRFCGWHLVPERVDTITLDGTGGHYLLIPTAHLVDVLAVSNDGVPIDPLDLEWSTAGVLKIPGNWTTKFRGAVVTVQHGWHPDAVMDLAVQTVLVAARVATAPRGESVMSVGGISGQLSASGLSLTPGEEALLAPYCVAGR